MVFWWPPTSIGFSDIQGSMNAELPAILAAIGFVAIAIFQAALALGAPFGAAAWGGTHPGRVPSRLRVASAFACVLWLFAALLVLERGGADFDVLPPVLARWGTWAVVILLPIGALMNFASRSRWERFVWGPLALVLAVLCLIVALGADA
jgi:hypothetical protein